MSENILVIEDDETFRTTVVDLLEKNGYSVFGVSDGHQAIDAAKKRLFQLVIADVRLPKGMDGIETAKAIKEIRPDAKTMVIVITGYADENAPIKAIRVGVDDYIYKPFKMEDFLHSVERNVRMYRLEKEKEDYLQKLEEMNKELKLAQSKLIQSKNELEDCNIKLEQEVEQRTRQLKQTEAQLIQSAKISALGQLGAGIAHELNNPIGGILGYAQFILRKFSESDFSPKDFKPCRQYVEYIEREAKRCKEIVENLLKFSRKSQAGFEPLAVKQILEDTLSIVRHQLKSQEIKVVTDYKPKLPQVSGNLNQLQQVFTNVIINAQHAMSKGGELSISVGTEKEGANKYLVISFKDTGCGIPEKNLEKIFEPFFTTKQDWKSIGIGLSIVYQIITEHKGTVNVESKEGVGTTVTIALPAI